MNFLTFRVQEHSENLPIHGCALPIVIPLILSNVQIACSLGRKQRIHLVPLVGIIFVAKWVGGSEALSLLVMRVPHLKNNSRPSSPKKSICQVILTNKSDKSLFFMIIGPRKADTIVGEVWIDGTGWDGKRAHLF